jgi:SAM-dependent methyltransferase
VRPAALTAELAGRAGAGTVSAAEPSASFVAAVRERLPGVDVRLAAAERLPFPESSFDVTLAQRVVHFMADPVMGLREMARVTQAGGLAAACVWDNAGDRGPLAVFWRAVRELDPAAGELSDRPGAREGDLSSLFAQAGLIQVQAATLTIRVRHASPLLRAVDRQVHQQFPGVGGRVLHRAYLGPAPGHLKQGFLHEVFGLGQVPRHQVGSPQKLIGPLGHEPFELPPGGVSSQPVHRCSRRSRRIPSPL